MNSDTKTSISKTRGLGKKLNCFVDDNCLCLCTLGNELAQSRILAHRSGNRRSVRTGEKASWKRSKQGTEKDGSGKQTLTLIS
ncbi:unnamed protein product [Nesidiocoris tenuis]|uniref:Uncharacterized protein n=1 Tax=Nesidiocoris tenuis TaxID=355587 RepID=A0A6H5G2N7_9HEMI|nr:unnamed protein product [Nesidiocoris tenuis]